MDRNVLQRVTSLPSNQAARKILDKHGLCAYTITWEDTARTKNSSLGPNISDMTLTADGTDLSIIRRPNFSDLTWDTPHQNIKLTVGNEHGEATRQVALETVLANLGDYLHEPLQFKAGTSLFDKERDVNVLMAAQACMLPVPKGDGQKTKFLVTLRNYQSRKDNPAVLVLVSTNDGTSAHVINTNGKEELFFNKDGQRCRLLGERLGAYRRSQNRPDDGSPMNEEERAKNMIMIVQVPLKQKKDQSRGAQGFSFGGGNESFSFGGGSVPKKAGTWGFGTTKQWVQEMESASGVALPDDADDDIGVSINELARYKSDDDEDSMVVEESIEHAIVSVGPPEGPYDELCGQGAKLKRDTRFPIRITLQYYRATSSGTLDEALAREIDEQFKEAKRFFGAVASGSLVVAGNDTGRTTEMKKWTVPAWWDTFWEIHAPVFGKRYVSKEAAAQVAFKHGRYTTRGMQQCENELLQVLTVNGSSNAQQ